MTPSVEHSQSVGPNTLAFPEGNGPEAHGGAGNTVGLTDGIQAVCSAPSIPSEAEFASGLLEDAESARRSVAALDEILAGCAPEHKISAFLFRSLLETALGHLESTVSGARVLANGVALH